MTGTFIYDCQRSGHGERVSTIARRANSPSDKAGSGIPTSNRGRHVFMFARAVSVVLPSPCSYESGFLVFGSIAQHDNDMLKMILQHLTNVSRRQTLLERTASVNSRHRSEALWHLFETLKRVHDKSKTSAGLSC